jgi:nicotinamide/nicotinate riboside kinase
VHNVQDWDSPEGCIEWERMVSSLTQVRETGAIPVDHRSHDHLNAQKEVPVDLAVLERWRRFFRDVQEERIRAGNDELVWGLVDGFLLYWNMVSALTLFSSSWRCLFLISSDVWFWFYFIFKF